MDLLYAGLGGLTSCFKLVYAEDRGKEIERDQGAVEVGTNLAIGGCLDAFDTHSFTFRGNSEIIMIDNKYVNIVQTRSEEFGLEEFPSIKEAFNRAKDDSSIWKISFALPSGERVRLIRQEDEYLGIIWIYDPIDDAIAKEMEGLASFWSFLEG